MNDLNDSNLLDPTEGGSDVEETTDSEAPAVEAPEGPETDSESPVGDPADAEPPWTPSPSLLETIGELIATRLQVETLRDQRKASAASYKQREDALDARIGDLTDRINNETWLEEFDAENGICLRTNRLTGETETQAYEPPPQLEIPFDAMANPEPDPDDETESTDDPIVAIQIIDHITSQWEGIGAIAERAGLDSKTASKLIKVELEKKTVEAEGEKRGRKYRVVA